MNYQVVGVCGFGFTGSGAVLDCLNNAQSVEVLDKFEFSIIYKPDGLQDLYYHLVENPTRYFSSDVAIRRFMNYCGAYGRVYNRLTSGRFTSLANDYINSLIQVEWIGSSSFHFVESSNIKRLFAYRIWKRFKKRFKRIIPTNWYYPDKEMYLSIKPDEFIEKSKLFVKQLIDSLRTKKDATIIVLDQPFSADNPTKSFRFFDSPKAIVVDKDPRDLYLLAKVVLGASGRFIPSDSVEKFCEYYRRIMSNADFAIKTDVLHLHFEDLIFNTENTYKCIAAFIGVNPSELYNGSFEPDKSISNTMLYLKYKQFSPDITYIEKELKEWLYPFDERLYKQGNGKSF